jgi:enterochelin esterase-like enzyme
MVALPIRAIVGIKIREEKMSRNQMTNIAKLVPAMCVGGMLGVTLMSPAAAQTCFVGFGTHVPAGANTTDPNAPFFINTQGLDLSTQPPTRSPNNPDYPPAIALADGLLPPIYANGNFIIGPTHTAAPETVTQPNVKKGKIYTFNMASTDSVIYKPGVVRDDPPNCPDGAPALAATAPGDPSSLFLTTSHPGTWSRTVTIYVPAGHHNQSELPFMVVGDGWTSPLFTILDNLISQRKLPPMVAIAIDAGGQDSQGSERGREYDTVSGEYAEWVEREVLPKVEQTAGVRLTKDPDGRATMGLSSSGAAAVSMAWFRPDLYHRVLAYSPTLVNQQWPHNPNLRGGAWEYHSPWAGPAGPNLNVNEESSFTPTPSTQPVATPLALQSARKPIRFWFETGDQDLFYWPPSMADGMHDWTLSSERFAKVLAAKGYQYQFVFSKNAFHVDGPTVLQTMPHALEYIWDGYPNRRIADAQGNEQ